MRAEVNQRQEQGVDTSKVNHAMLLLTMWPASSGLVSLCVNDNDIYHIHFMGIFVRID
jgi:hypothetical protein